MKICWDNLEKLKYKPNKSGWYDKHRHLYIYKDACKNCGEPFLTCNDGVYCDKSCSKIGENNPFYGMGYLIMGKNNPFFGKKHSNETLEKLSILQSGENNASYGKKCSYETKLKISISNSGYHHPNWKGGITVDPYCSGWRQLAQELKECDDNKCQNPLCEGKSKRITSHHIDYNKEHCHPSNLITLCNSCNTRANYNRDFWQEFYTKLKRPGDI